MRIGQKVVCIDDSIKPGKEEFVRAVYPNWVKKDETYTIRDIRDNNDIVTGIVLKELVNQPIYIHLIEDFQEPAFRMDRFRELDEFEETEELSEVVTTEKVIEKLLTPYNIQNEH